MSIRASLAAWASRALRRKGGGEDNEPSPAPPSVPAAATPEPASKPLPASGPAPFPYKRFPNLPGSDQEVIAKAGRDVCARVATLASVRRVPALQLEIYAADDFLSADECERLIALIDGDAQPSTILGAAAGNPKRTSHTCRLPSDHPLVAQVEARICELLGLPQSHSETAQGQRYTVGQHFKLHNDYFSGGRPYSEAVAQDGGQRTWTAMAYLNRPESGGSTDFPRAMVKIDPKPGTLLFWNNNDRQGLSNPFSHHEGTSVEAGSKYVLTKWFRERERGCGEAPGAGRT